MFTIIENVAGVNHYRTCSIMKVVRRCSPRPEKKKGEGYVIAAIYIPTHHSKMFHKGEFIPRKRVSLGDKTEKNGLGIFWGEELNKISREANGITGVNSHAYQ
jgi:hypothetical protein